jgi:hypothetical protein
MTEPRRTEPDSLWNKPHVWVGILSSFLFLWLAMRQVSWPDVVAEVQVAEWRLVLLGSVLIVSTWAIFAVRWQVLLSPLVSAGWLDAFSCIMVGYLGNALLPLRLGDIARIGLTSRNTGVNIGFTSAAAAVERLLDVVTLAALAGPLMFLIPIPGAIGRGVQLATLAASGLFVLLAILAHSGGAVARSQSLLSSHLPEKLSGLLFGMLHRFIQGLQMSGSSRKLLKASLLSLLSWGVATLSIWCYLQAFQLSVPWQAGALVLVATNLGGAIPSSPGAVGVYEFLAILALSIWLPNRDAAFGFAATVHTINLGLGIVLGLIALWRQGIQLSTLATLRVSTESQDGREPPVGGDCAT